MPARQKGEKRKQRWVGATDAEWAEISEGAQAAGLSNFRTTSSGAALTARRGPKRPMSVCPSPVLRRAVKAVLILEELQRLRLANDGEIGEALWRRAVGEVDAWIKGEGDLG